LLQTEINGMTGGGIICGQLRRNLRVARLLKQFGNLSPKAFGFENSLFNISA